MKTELQHFTSQRNVERDELFPTPTIEPTPDQTDEQTIIRGNNSVESAPTSSVDIDSMFNDMFQQFASALHSQEYARPQPLYQTQLDETGLQFVDVQVGEKTPAVYDMYDSLILYARGSILGGQLAIRPELFSENVKTIDEYIEAYVQEGIQNAVAAFTQEASHPAHITVGEEIDNEETQTFRGIVKKITGRTLEIVGINPLYHSAPTKIIQRTE